MWAAADLRCGYANRSGDPELLRLANRALSYLPDVPRPFPPPEGGASPVIGARLRVGDEIVSTFSTVLRFESAQEVTISELRLEMVFPADPRSGEIMRWLATA